MSFGISATDGIALPQFAWQVYKTCRDSPSDFKELSGEVNSMHAALREVEDLVGRHSLSEASKIRLDILRSGCRDLLKSLEKHLARYKSLGAEKKRIRDRLRWGMESVGDMRIKLISHTAMLGLFTSSLAR